MLVPGSFNQKVYSILILHQQVTRFILVFGQNCVKTRIHFNSRDAYAKKDDATEEDEGPIVERKCPKCGNDKMSYATLQLRSADEGQTVFYTCTECKYKESENS